MPKIFVTDDRFGSYDIEKGILAEIGGELHVFHSLRERGALESIGNADALLVNQAVIDEKVLSELKSCRIISRYGTGYDNVDVESATAKGIWVSRVPDYCYEEVAEHALALLLTCSRAVNHLDRNVRRGKWDIHPHIPIRRISTRVLGVIGYGGTGRSFHHKAMCLGFSRVLVHDTRITDHDIAWGEVCLVGLEQVLRESDFLSVHIPLNSETRHFINAERLGMMKPDAILINTSRGGVLDTNALVDALRNGRLAGAGLDVHENEPMGADHPLFAFDNVVLTDHSAYYSIESLAELKLKAARNIVAVFTDGSPVYPVNRL